MTLFLILILSNIYDADTVLFKILYNETKPKKLIWGKDNFIDSIPIETDRITKLHSDHNHLLLQVSCGTPFWYLLILPLNSQDTIKTIQYNLELDTINKLILGAADNSSSLKILNYQTGISDSIETLNCQSAVFLDCINDFWFSNDSLYIKWNDTLISKNLSKELFYSF